MKADGRASAPCALKAVADRVAVARPQLIARTLGSTDVTTSLRDFERRLLEAAIEGDPESEVLMAQISAAEVVERDYTGIGLYVHVAVPAHLPKLQRKRRGRQLAGAARLCLTHPLLEHGAGTIVWVEDGRVDCIECFAYDETWPSDDAAFQIVAEAPEGDPGKSA